MLELQLAELEAAEKAATPAPWHGDPLDGQIRQLVSRWDKRLWAQNSDIALTISLRNAAPQFIALAKAAQGLRKALQARAKEADNLPHKTGCICHWCEQIEIATDILFAGLEATSAHLPSVKEPAK